MKHLGPTLFLGVALVTHSCAAQRLPDAPSERIHRVVPDKTTRVMLATDFTLRTFDVISTRQLLGNPCKCYYEMDPVSPTSLPGLIAFQYAAASGIAFGSYLLTKHKHPRIAKLLIAMDLTSEGWAVQNNERLLQSR